MRQHVSAQREEQRHGSAPADEDGADERELQRRGVGGGGAVGGDERGPDAHGVEEVDAEGSDAADAIEVGGRSQLEAVGGRVREEFVQRGWGLRCGGRRGREVDVGAVQGLEVFIVGSGSGETGEFLVDAGARAG
jgi:hypothetical protein